MRPSVRQAMAIALQLPEDAKLAWEVYAELAKIMKSHFRREGRPRLEVVKSGPASFALASADPHASNHVDPRRVKGPPVNPAECEPRQRIDEPPNLFSVRLAAASFEDAICVLVHAHDRRHLFLGKRRFENE